MTERYPYVSTSERRRRMDEIFFNHKTALDKLAFQGELDRISGMEHFRSISRVNRTIAGLACNQDEIDKQINALPSYLKPWYQSSKPKLVTVTMTTPRQSFRNWVEELPRWIPHALRASALITAILYGVAL